VADLSPPAVVLAATFTAPQDTRAEA
jgi:hypothetical protein